MYGLIGVCLFDFVEEDFSSVDWGGCSGHASDEDLDTVVLEDGGDAAPVRHFEGHDGGANSDGVEAQETMAEDDGMGGGEVGLGRGRVVKGLGLGEPGREEAAGLGRNAGVHLPECVDGGPRRVDRDGGDGVRW